MLFSTQKAAILAALVAYAEARFGQEQTPIAAISAVTSGGGPGVAATIAGGAISTLLAAANPCAKLQTADNIITQLGTGADSLAAAIGLVAAEQNFNPFVTDKPTFCSDPTLPKTAALRGITPLVDPAVTGADAANALSAKSTKTPFNADGLSVAQVIAAQGFTNFATKDLAGTAGSGAPSGASNSTAAASTSGSASAVSVSAAATLVASGTAAASQTSAASTVEESCPSVVTVTVSAGGAAQTSAVVASASIAASSSAVVSSSTSGAAAPASTASAGGVQKSTIAGLDFGLCVPTIKFEGGLGGRPATEFTFQAIDPLVSKGQQEALNPAIIVNRVCDQLTNVCQANAAAKAACLAAKAKVDPAQKVAQTATDFNTALGFADAVVTPPAATAPAADVVDANPTVQKSTIAGLDFGKCVPTMKFQGGLGGRPATEFTFQAIDPIVALGQQEALNPAIIVNRICDQLTNVCGANAAAKTACLSAKAAVDPAKKVAQTATDFNTALGFADADINAARRRNVEALKRRSARF